MGDGFGGAIRGAGALAFGAIAVVLSVMLAAGSAHAADLSVDRSDDPDLAATPTADNCTSLANDCSLRGAIARSNALASTDTIGFAIPDGPDPGLEIRTISPGSRLPAITDTVTVDGYTQPGASPNDATTNANSAVLKVEINGTGAGVGSAGLALSGEGAAGSVIRGLVINRFGGSGVSADAGATVLEGNFIGTDPSGTIARGNGTSGGVLVTSANNRIGGPANAAQNVISGNAGGGVNVVGADSTGNVISNNHIGTDADAGEALGNAAGGVFVASPGVIVGGVGANGAGIDLAGAQGEGNIISGNVGAGVFVTGDRASGTRVMGNYIGVDLNGNGLSEIGNSGDGVRVDSAPGVEVGGTGSTFSNGEGNTISDNGRNGVLVFGPDATNNKILGNRIGTDFNGNADFGNTLDGVRIEGSPNNTVGGTVSGTRNVISGNSGNGVLVAGSGGTTSNKVQGNFIGTDASGNSDLGNGEVGVLVETPGNSVGGTATGARNVISGNAGVGVSLLGAGADGNTVQGNFIGTDADGEVSPNGLGNFHGVFVFDASDKTIGGTVPAAANVISGNANHGVMVIGDTATGNSILRNSISENGSPGGLGIELSNGGVTPNDRRDPDAGPNTLQNFPVITSAGATRIGGTLNSRPRKTFTVQFFSNPAPNFPTGFGEGETFLGQKRVTTNRKGRASFTFSTVLSPGQVVTATATNAGGSTSEFSQGRTVG